MYDDGRPCRNQMFFSILLLRRRRGNGNEVISVPNTSRHTDGYFRPPQKNRLDSTLASSDSRIITVSICRLLKDTLQSHWRSSQFEVRTFGSPNPPSDYTFPIVTRGFDRPIRRRRQRYCSVAYGSTVFYVFFDLFKKHKIMYNV